MNDYDLDYELDFNNNNEGVMEQIKSCTPAFAYFAVSLIILLVGVGVSCIAGKFSFSEICSQLCSIIMYTAIFVFLCRYNMTLAWGVFAICTISFISGIAGRISFMFKDSASEN